MKLNIFSFSGSNKCSQHEFVLPSENHERHDIRALGFLSYQLLTLRPPYEDVLHIPNIHPRPKLQTQYSENLQNAVMKMLYQGGNETVSLTSIASCKPLDVLLEFILHAEAQRRDTANNCKEISQKTNESKEGRNSLAMSVKEHENYASQGNKATLVTTVCKKCTMF